MGNSTDSEDPHEMLHYAQKLILCIIRPGRLDLPMARTNFHGPKPV